MKEQISTYAGDWSATDAAILAAIEADTVENPAPCPMIKPPFTIADILGRISNVEDLKQLDASITTLRLYDEIDNQKHDGVILWAYTNSLMGKITPEDAGAIMQFLSTPVPDPAYRAQIPALELEIGRAITLDDVMDARRAWMDAQAAQEAN